MMNNLTSLNSRKLRKPLLERKRRARINRSLDEMYEFLVEAACTEKGTKLEKADILEMTVQYLKQLKRHDDSAENKENLENVLLERYLEGFEKCAKEIEILVEPQLRHDIQNHLRDCVERVKSERRNLRLEDGEKGVEATGKDNPCPVLVQRPEALKILPSKLPNGDVLLVLSSSKCEGRRDAVWRPWW